MPTISAVLPCFNEEPNIPRMVPEVLGTLQRLASDYEVIVVNDGSRDGTANVTRDLAARHPQVKLAEHAVNQGYGAALATGFSAARCEWIFLTDGDKQFVVAELDKLVPHLEHADLIVGYREPRRDPFHRRLFGWGWNFLINLLFGYTARDVDCAFKLFRRTVWRSVKVESRGATFSAEFLVRARRRGFRMVELNVTHLPRTAGSPTGGRLDVIVRAFRDLFRFRYRLWREEQRTRGRRQVTS
ncbi:MAG: glycosyltransferase family 2 protein [Chloroflexi bacterium]|nr:glycosyltransferase family 2 protein [Chloroflexota bacterium]